MTLPVCLVTGATGAIGPAVVDALAGRFQVRTLTRRPPEPGLFGAPVTPFTGDVADVATVRQAAEGARAIVHLAALLHIVDPHASLRAEYERVNVGGTAAVIDAAKAEDVSRVVLLSTIAVYGSQPRGLVDEGSPTHPDTYYGETKLQAERVAIGARTDDGRPLSTVLRSAAVYGPRVKGNYQRLVRALARHRFVPIGPGDNRRTLVHEQDLAAATLLAAEHAAAAGRTYNISDGHVHALRDIIAAICAALGRRPPRWHAPVAPLRAAFHATSVINPRLPGMLNRYLEEIAVDGSRIQAELGFRPGCGLVEGWRTTVAEMRRNGSL